MSAALLYELFPLRVTLPISGDVLSSVSVRTVCPDALFPARSIVVAVIVPAFSAGKTALHAFIFMRLASEMPERAEFVTEEALFIHVRNDSTVPALRAVSL